MTVRETDETKAETVVSHTLPQGHRVCVCGNTGGERQRFPIPTLNRLDGGNSGVLAAPRQDLGIEFEPER